MYLLIMRKKPQNNIKKLAERQIENNGGMQKDSCLSSVMLAQPGAKSNVEIR